MLHLLENWTDKDYQSKHYKTGMYGGKFMPMHKGHLYCLEQACRLCDKVYLILFVGGSFEKTKLDFPNNDILSIESRWNQVQKAAKMFGNKVVPLIINVANCVADDGEEDWDSETPLILNACRHFDVVFASEIDYVPYFKRAYPWADCIIVDSNRVEVPISATDIRSMDAKEAKKWLV